MPIDPVKTSDLEAAVTDAEGAAASIEVFVQGFADKIKQAVSDALTADAAANNTSIAAANGAIDAVTSRVKAVSAGLAAAVTA